MTQEPSFLEAELRDLQAATLDEALLSRLEAAANGSLTQLSHEEMQFEAYLRDIPPAPLTEDFMSGLETIVREVPFSVNEKIVLFPKANAVQKARHSLPMWGAAAAVALFGAVSALMIPAIKPASKPITHTPEAARPFNQNPSGSFAPASFDRGLSEVRDEGVIWKSKHQAQRVVRVVYKDIITLNDENGRTVQVEQPRVEFLLVPAKTD